MQQFNCTIKFHMGNSSLIERLSRGSLLSDGAMGTQLYAQGITGVPIEAANLERT